jgi:hypothetical protein
VHTVGIVRFCQFILYPLTKLFGGWQWLVSKVVRVEESDSDISDELITMVDEAEKEGDLEAHESDLISAAIEFNDLDVKDVLTPRVNVLAINITMSIEEVEKLFRLNSFSRLPVYENSVDNIVGVIHEKDFYSMLYSDKERRYLRRIIKPVIYTTGSCYDRYVRSSSLEKYPLWIRNVYFRPLFAGKPVFWQYADDKKLEGYKGEEEHIDMNVFFGDKEKLKDYTIK